MVCAQATEPLKSRLLCLDREGKNVDETAEDDDDGDNLDKLLKQYEAQAEEDKRRVLPVAKEKPASQMGMAQLRETGMSKPLTSDNKCVDSTLAVL